jgi:hypothetical protein
VCYIFNICFEADYTNQYSGKWMDIPNNF